MTISTRLIYATESSAALAEALDRIIDHAKTAQEDLARGGLAAPGASLVQIEQALADAAALHRAMMIVERRGAR